jgi:hypothetical protein
MKESLALFGWSLWFLAFTVGGAYNAIGHIRASDDLPAALWVALTLVFAGRSVHYANLLAKP